MGLGDFGGIASCETQLGTFIFGVPLVPLSLFMPETQSRCSYRMPRPALVFRGFAFLAITASRTVLYQQSWLSLISPDPSTISQLSALVRATYKSLSRSSIWRSCKLLRVDASTSGTWSVFGFQTARPL